MSPALKGARWQPGCFMGVVGTGREYQDSTWEGVGTNDI